MPAPSATSARGRPTIFLAGAAAILATAASVYWLKRQQDRKRKTQDPFLSNEQIPGDLGFAFEQACEEVKEMSLPQSRQLELYGLYKQATMGPASGTPPPAFNMVASVKYRAWKELGQMPRPMAMVIYIELVELLKEGGESEPGEEDVLSGGFGGAAPTSTLYNAEVDDEEFAAKEGETLHAAALTGNLEMMSKLLTRYKNTSEESLHPDCNDESGQTALHLAADRNHPDCVKTLLDAGANVQQVDSEGISVLQAAVIAGSLKVCRILLEYGADPDQADQDGDTPRSCAEEDGSPDLVALFEARGKDEDTKTEVTVETGEDYDEMAVLDHIPVHLDADGDMF